MAANRATAENVHFSLLQTVMTRSNNEEYSYDKLRTSGANWWSRNFLTKVILLAKIPLNFTNDIFCVFLFFLFLFNGQGC